MHSEYASFARTSDPEGDGEKVTIPLYPPLLELVYPDLIDGCKGEAAQKREMCGKVEQVNRIPDKYNNQEEYLWQMQCHMAVEFSRSMASNLKELHSSPAQEPGQEKAWFSFEVIKVDPEDKYLASVRLTETEPRNLRRLSLEFDHPEEEDSSWWAGWMMEVEGYDEVVLVVGRRQSSWLARKLLLYFPFTRPTSLHERTPVRLRLVEYVQGAMQHYSSTQCLRKQLMSDTMSVPVKDLLHQVANPTLKPGWTAQSEGLVKPSLLSRETLPGTAEGIVNGLQGGLQAIQGPPGTGKSTTIRTIIKDRIPPNNKTIVACTKNKAVDAVVGKLVSLPGSVVVFGNKRRLGPEAKLHTLAEQVGQHKLWVLWQGIFKQLEGLRQQIEDSIAAAMDWCSSPSSLLHILSSMSSDIPKGLKQQLALQKVLSRVDPGGLDVQVIADTVVKHMQIQDQATLMGLVNIIFNRATEEQGPAEMCARLCKSISAHSLAPKFPGGSDDIDICSILLDKCERELHGAPVGRHAAAVQSSSKAGQHPCSPELLAPGDVQDATAKVKLHRTLLEAQAAVRQRNAAPLRPSEKDLDGLDKSVKGNSKLVGRLRAGGPVLQIPSSGGDDGARPPFVRGSGTVSGTIGVAALLADFAKANQKKYLGDLASALVDAPKKEIEVAGALEVAAFLHQRYEEFAVHLMSEIMRVHQAFKASSSSGKERQSLHQRQQFCLRLAAEAVVVGIFGASNICKIRGMLKDAVSEKIFLDVSKEEATMSASALAFLVKPTVCEVLFGFPLSSLDLPVPLSMLQEDAPVWKQPTGVAEALVALRTELQALKEAREQQWKLPVQEASELSKALESSITRCTRLLLNEYERTKEKEAAGQAEGRSPFGSGDQKDADKSNATTSLRASLASLYRALGQTMPAEVLDAEAVPDAAREGSFVVDRAAARRAAKEEQACRLRKLHVFVFVGCLYEQEILAESIVHDWVGHVIKDCKEFSRSEDIKCLCEVLAIAGAKLDATADPDSKVRTQEFFKDLQEMREHSKVGGSIGFMINDLLKWRASEWSPLHGPPGSRKAPMQTQAHTSLNNSLMARLFGPQLSPKQLSSMKSDMGKKSRKVKVALVSRRWRTAACKVVALRRMGLLGLYFLPTTCEPSCTASASSYPSSSLSIPSDPDSEQEELQAPSHSAAAAAAAVAASNLEELRLCSNRKPQLKPYPLKKRKACAADLDYQTPAQIAKMEAELAEKTVEQGAELPAQQGKGESKHTSQQGGVLSIKLLDLLGDADSDAADNSDESEEQDTGVISYNSDKEWQLPRAGPVDALQRLKAALAALWRSRDEPDSEESKEAYQCLQKAMDDLRSALGTPLRVRSAAVAQEIKLETLVIFFKALLRRVDISKVSEEAQEDVLLSARAFLSTIDSVPAMLRILGKHHADLVNNLKSCIIDEAGCVPEYEIPLLLSAGPITNLFLIGDHKQLPCFSRIPKEEQKRNLHNHSRSLLQRMVDCGVEVPMLVTQYRMAEQICNVVSSCFYEGRLQTGLHVPKRQTEKCMKWAEVKDGYPSKSAATYNMSRQNRYESNKFEAMRAINEAVAGFDVMVAEGVKEPSVFIITPYNQQCAVLQDLHMLCEASRPELKSIQVMTVDKAQGSEADVVVLSLVKIGAFMLDTKRANVALSRARKLSILVGNVEYMKRDAGSGRFWNQVIDGYVAATRGVAPALSVAQLRLRASSSHTTKPSIPTCVPGATWEDGSPQPGQKTRKVVAPARASPDTVGSSRDGSDVTASKACASSLGTKDSSTSLVDAVAQVHAQDQAPALQCSKTKRAVAFVQKQPVQEQPMQGQPVQEIKSRAAAKAPPPALQEDPRLQNLGQHQQSVQKGKIGSEGMFSCGALDEGAPAVASNMSRGRDNVTDGASMAGKTGYVETGAGAFTSSLSGCGASKEPKVPDVSPATKSSGKFPGMKDVFRGLMQSQGLNPDCPHDRKVFFDEISS